MNKDWVKQLVWQIPLLAIFCFLAGNLSGSLNHEFEKFMPETIVNCSSHNDRSSGYKAFFEAAQKAGMNCQQFAGAYRDLSSEKGALLVVAPNYFMKAYDIELVLDWVAKGNKLVYLDYCSFGAAKNLLDKLGITVRANAPVEDLLLLDLPKSDETQHVSRLILSTESRLKGGTALVEDKHGAFLIKMRHGKGTCIISTLPNLCSNRRVCDTKNWGNFQLLYNCVQTPSGKILFDERVHGYNNAQNAFIYLLRGPAGLICLHLLIIFFILLASLNQRFGPARLILSKRKIASSEYIDGMAHTYMKARANDTALAILFGSFRTRLCKALSLAPSESAQTIAGHWSESTQLSNKETLDFLENAERLQNSRATNEEELLNVMKECDRLYEASRPHLSVQPGRRLGG